MKDWVFIVFALSLTSGLSQESVSDEYEKFEYSEETWETDYELFERTPYGGFLMSEILDVTFKAEYLDKPIFDAFNEMYYEYGGYTYVLFGYDMHMRRKDMDKLLEFVEFGNNAVIMVEYLPNDLQYLFFTEDWFSQSAFKLQLSHAETDSLARYPLSYISNYESQTYDFRLIDTSTIRKEFVYYPIVSESNGKSVCVQIQYGSGHFYFITAPMMMTNFYLKQPHGKAFFYAFFGRFEETKILLDSETAHPFIVSYTDQDLLKDGPLGYVMKNASLRWGYALLVLAGLLFLFFRGKRRQAVIPLIESDKNSSREFVETVSGLYLSKKRHDKLISQKRRVFMHFVRNRYFIPGSEADDTYRKQLEIRSGVDRELIDRIFNGFKKAVGIVPVHNLIALHNDIEEFHKTCK